MTATTNSIMAIRPYRVARNGPWVFDDDTVGLKREPFVGDANRWIDRAVQDAGLRNAHRGFTLLFSDTWFPDATITLFRMEPEHGGTWYRCHHTGVLGWLCPALFLYFPEAPRALYAAAHRGV